MAKTTFRNMNIQNAILKKATLGHVRLEKVR